MPETFRECWTTLQQEYRACTESLLSDLRGTWEEICSAVPGVKGAFSSFDANSPEPEKLESFRFLVEQLAPGLALEPISTLQKKRPLHRALTAIQDYEAALADLVRQLPTEAQVTGRELVESLGRHVPPLRRRRSRIVLPLREVASAQLAREALRRADIDGEFQLLLSEACLHLIEPWQICRRCVLSILAHGKRDGAELAQEREWWFTATDTLGRRAEALLALYRDWAESAARRQARALARASGVLPESRRTRRQERLRRYFSYWARQGRAVRSLWDLERHVTLLEKDSAAETARAAESLEVERDDILHELDQVTGWLQAWQHARGPEPFPPPMARLVSAEERVSEWEKRILRLADSGLPYTVEGVAPRDPLPAWRTPFRQLEPQKALKGALENSGRPLALPGLREAEAAHRAVIRGIERAREVVAFGFEAAQAEAAGEADFAGEAAANALSLLLYQRRTLIDVRPIAESSLARAQAVTFLEMHVTLEEGRLGALAYLTRRHGALRAQQLRQVALAALRASSRRVLAALRRANQWVLLKTGLTAPPVPRLEPVSERAYLGQILDVRLGARDLPMLYRRLFRLAPVEDPRFLVGRDAEMQGISDALSRWRAGRNTSVIVVGARGSGKTSLMNCAVIGLLSGATVVRGQFRARAAGPQAVEEVLRALLQLPKGASLERTLSDDARVIVIEELERAFLRAVGGLDGLRSLLHLIETTSRATLWMLSINETSFRYLDVTAGLSRAFSHRINAMSVAPEHIAGAILQRHNLSGLRLEFAPPPEGDRRIRKVRRFLGLEEEPQRLFFDALYGQSEGIFRAAFELWQDCIERVEGGVVHMRQPLAPDYEPLFKEMRLNDLFILQAVLQHGGLTHEELTQVFGIGMEQTRRDVERLLALEVLEPEPDCAGFRVRPEASRFVREALRLYSLW